MALPPLDLPATHPDRPIVEPSPARVTEPDGLAQLRLLGSGSSGNALYLALGEVRLLIDAGLSTRAIVKALAEMGLALSSLTAVLLTHEHVDHIQAVPGLIKRCPRLPICASLGTINACRELYGWNLPFIELEPLVSTCFGMVQVTPFEVSHDAAQPVGFRLVCRELSFALATDLGTVTPTVVEMLSACRVLAVEANHNRRMLREGPYPDRLKRRITSGKGHLSNQQTAELLRAVAGPHVEQLILVHLSEVNNSPGQALTDLAPALKLLPRSRVAVAAPRVPGPLLQFSIAAGKVHERGAAPLEASQLNLFQEVPPKAGPA
ncbi:MAG: MBL fold metallo-hydrolase [Bradymonadales bacterium]|nr:MBL fold metallo-hydrolase [Bradymonadales bacterium]